MLAVFFQMVCQTGHHRHQSAPYYHYLQDLAFLPAQTTQKNIPWPFSREKIPRTALIGT